MKKRFSFFILRKNFNTGEIEQYDIMPKLYSEIFDNEGHVLPNLSIYGMTKVDSKEKFFGFVKSHMAYNYWAKCEWEYIAIDWPWRTECDENSDLININRPVKIDAYQQIMPNINIIVDLLWEEVKDEI